MRETVEQHGGPVLKSVAAEREAVLQTNELVGVQKPVTPVPTQDDTPCSMYNMRNTSKRCAVDHAVDLGDLLLENGLAEVDELVGLN